MGIWREKDTFSTSYGKMLYFRFILYKKKAENKLKPKSTDQQAYQSSLSLHKQLAKKAIAGQYLVCFPFLWKCQMLSHH